MAALSGATSKNLKFYSLMKTTFFNRCLLAALLALSALSTRAAEEQDLIAVLRSNAPVPAKCAACQRLRYAGTLESVPALAALLGEDRASHAARYALEGMPYPEAGAALRQALEKTSGLIKAGLADSAGWRRDTAAVPVLLTMLAGQDPVLAGSAAAALGRIGGAEAIAGLTAARNTAAGALQTTVIEALLQCAEQLLAAGDALGAAGVYRGLESSKLPAAVQAAAWRGGVMADELGRAKRVVQGLLSDEPMIRATAVKVARELNDMRALKACMGVWEKLSEEAQLAVLAAHVGLGPEARTAVRVALKSDKPAVRVAALEAMAGLGDVSVLSALAQAAASGSVAERETARDTLARFAGAGAREAILVKVNTAAAPEKAAFLRALGDRGDTKSADVLLKSAGSDSAVVRAAALESLKRLALPETVTPLLELAAKAASDEAREPALQALYAVCQASADKEAAARGVLTALQALPAAERRAVLPVLAELAVPAALEAALAATRDADPAMVRAGVGVLSAWPSAAAAPRLMELAGSATDPSLQVLALRGAIDTAGQEPDLTRRLASLKQILAAARRPDEKKLALGQIGQIPTPAALELVMGELANPALAGEAALAAVAIAEKCAASDPKLAASVAARILAECKTEAVVKRAWALRGKIKASGPFLKDWLISGPYSQPGATGAQGVFDIVFPPEKPGADVRWKPAPRGDMIEMLGLFPNAASCAAYLKTIVIAPEACDAAFLAGSDDGLKVWLNGAVVLSQNVDRGAVADQDMAPIKLKKGPNELLMKVTQGGGGWAVCARIVGTDGIPITGLKSQVPK